jgi:hypothetical protein
LTQPRPWSLIPQKSKLEFWSSNLFKPFNFRRKCFYQNENQLRFFKVYSQSNCEWECLTNFTMKACGCVMFYMPSDRLLILKFG